MEHTELKRDYDDLTNREIRLREVVGLEIPIMVDAKHALVYLREDEVLVLQPHAGIGRESVDRLMLIDDEDR